MERTRFWLHLLYVRTICWKHAETGHMSHCVTCLACRVTRVGNIDDVLPHRRFLYVYLPEEISVHASTSCTIMKSGIARLVVSLKTRGIFFRSKGRSVSGYTCKNPDSPEVSCSAAISGKDDREIPELTFSFLRKLEKIFERIGF